jgi:hypothetical protein
LEAYKYDVKQDVHIMIDSGAFSFHMFLAKKKKIENIDALREKTIGQYVEFCQKRKERWDFYVTFDYIHSQKVVWEVTRRLEKEGLRPTPVYHGDCAVEELKKWLDKGYKRIGISSLPWRRFDYRQTRMYLDAVFRVCEPYKVKLHGFAITSLSLAFFYPWCSVDSSTWARAASYGAIYGLDVGRATLSSIHVSLTGGLKSTTTTATSLTPEALKSVKAQVEEEGWDFELLRRSLQYRFCYNAWVFAHLNRYKKYIRDMHVQWERLV